jgi:protein-S-isoprenylcysteine O-methyltransferase Ste14
MTSVSIDPEPAVSSPQDRRTVDWGRIVMVPISVILGGLALVRLVSLLTAEGDSVSGVALAAVTGVLTAAFYVLIVRAYLRRGAASATSRVRFALVAGPVATFLPFALPFVGSGGRTSTLLILGDVLLVVGFAYSIWAVRCLDRSLSVVPQARTLVQHGPYATVRHPLYLGELVAMLGLALTLGGPWPLVLWTVLVSLQGYRAVQEERLLRANLPEYADYQTRTARIVPGLF